MQINKTTWWSTQSLLQEQSQDEKTKLLKKKDDDESKNLGAKTIIQKSISAASDGSSVMTLTKITVNSNGSHTPPKIIGTYKLGKNSDETGTKTLQKAFDPKQNSAQSKAQFAENQYEQNSLTSQIASGTMLIEEI